MHLTFYFRAEYDHPCVVNKSRKKPVEMMNDEYKDYNDWSKFQKDPNVQILISNEAASIQLQNRSSDEHLRLEKIKKANKKILK